MKTKEVIRLLQECDPTGEEEVLVGNHDIHDICREPAYYDGYAQIMIRDESIECYNIIGARWTGKGQKISINSIGIQDAIFNNPDVPVTIEADYPRLEKLVEGWRKECREIEAAADARAKNRAEKEKKS